MNIKVKYFNEDYPKMEKIEQGDWIDLRVDNIKEWESERYILSGTDKDKLAKLPMVDSSIKYKEGDILFLGLGVAMELPEGYEAHVLPRSSTFKKTGFILTNGMGIIDNKYCGDDDEWKAMVYCTRDGIINRHDKLFQFRIVENQPKLNFNEVEVLNNKNRGGFGSTD